MIEYLFFHYLRISFTFIVVITWDELEHGARTIILNFKKPANWEALGCCKFTKNQASAESSL